MPNLDAAPVGGGLGVDQVAPTVRVADGAQPRAPPGGQQKGLANRLGAAAGRARPDDERRLRAVRDARQAADRSERCLDEVKRGVARRGDENGVGAAEVALGPERQAVAEAHERLAAERQVELGDPEAVQARDDRQHTAGLGGQLGADAVPREARDGVPPAHRKLDSMVLLTRTCTPSSDGFFWSQVHTSPLASVDVCGVRAA